MTIQQQENKVYSQNETIHKKDSIIKDMDQKQNVFRLRIEALEAQIQNLNSEKEHLELALTENKKLKEQYFNRSEEMFDKYQQIFKELNEFQKDKVAIDEIKLDRDNRIDKFREELNEVNKTLDELNKEHSSLQVKHQWLTDEYAKMEAEFNKMVDNLNVANDIRQKTEETLKRVQKDYELQGIKLKNEVERAREFELDLQKVASRLLVSEKQVDELEIKKDSLMK